MAPEHKPRRPHERLEGETHAQWRAFQKYCQMGLTEVRNKTKLSEMIGYGTKKNITRWARENRWDERIKSYDDFMAEKLQEELLIQQKVMVSEHAATAKELRRLVDEGLKNINVSKLRPTDLVKMLDLATKIERLAVGMPTDHTRIEDEANEAVKDLAGWARRKQLQRASDEQKRISKEEKGEN